MDGLSNAASVIAVIQLAESVYKLCQGYIFSVKDARRDIGLLCKEIMALHDVLVAVREWFKEGDSTTSGTVGQLRETSRRPLDICQKELESIGKTLERFQSTTDPEPQNTMRRFGMRALKWPFSEKDLKARIDALSGCKETLNLALTAETTYVMRTPCVGIVSNY